VPPSTQSTVAPISVAIATLDRPDGVARCLDAVLAGTVRPVQIVIVDQSATDATERRLADRSSVPGLVYVRQPRLGLSASRNGAVAASTGAIVAFTDDDCVPSAGWVEAIDRALGDRELAAVTGAVLDLGPDPSEPRAVPSSLRRATTRRTFRRRALPWVVGTGGNMAIRRTWLERIGPFDERLGAGSPGKAGEDMDMIHRLLRAGGRVQYDPAVEVRHARHPPAARHASRSTYGYGMGVFCGRWIRRGDPYAGIIWARWLLDRARVALGAARRGRWRDIDEQVRYVAGGAAGFAAGLVRDDR
jgi:GT2 family glycosyltransferase